MASGNATTICPEPFEEFEDNQRVIGLVLFAFGTAYFSTFLLLWVARRHRFELVKRDGRYMLVTMVGCYFQLLTTCWVNYAGVNALPCDVHAWTVFFVVPLAAGPLVVRLVVFYHRAMYYRKAASKDTGNGKIEHKFRRASFGTELRALIKWTFAKSSKRAVTHRPKDAAEDRDRSESVASEGTDGTASSDSATLALHFVATSRFYSGAVFSIFFLMGLITVAFQYFEADSPYGGKGCYGCAMSGSDIYFLVAVLALVVVGAFVSLRRINAAKVPDPLNILAELKLCLLFGAIAVLGMLLASIDPGQLRAEGKLDYMYLVSVSVIAIVHFTCARPVLSTFRRGGGNSKFSTAITFDAVMDSAEAKAAFTSYLVTEFSTENIYFHDAVAAYKRTWDAIDARTCEGQAGEIVEAFVASGSMLQVNISFAMQDAVIKSYEHARSTGQKPPLDLFDKADIAVCVLIEADSFPRFLRSKFFSPLLQERTLAAAV